LGMPNHSGMVSNSSHMGSNLAQPPRFDWSDRGKSSLTCFGVLPKGPLSVHCRIVFSLNLLVVVSGIWPQTGQIETTRAANNVVILQSERIDVDSIMTLSTLGRARPFITSDFKNLFYGSKMTRIACLPELTFRIPHWWDGLGSGTVSA